jgi:hypothetical protein
MLQYHYIWLIRMELIKLYLFLFPRGNKISKKDLLGRLL